MLKTKSPEQYATHACNNSTGKDSISKLSFLLPLESNRTETVVRWIRWDSHWQGADGLGWPIHENDHQQPPNFSYILHTYTCTILHTKWTCIPLAKVNHKTNAHISTVTSPAVPRYISYIALHKIPLDSTFVARIFTNFTYYIRTRNFFNYF